MDTQPRAPKARAKKFRRVAGAQFKFALKKAHLCNFLKNDHRNYNPIGVLNWNMKNVRSRTRIQSKDGGQIIRSAEGASETFADLQGEKVILPLKLAHSNHVLSKNVRASTTVLNAPIK